MVGVLWPVEVVRDTSAQLAVEMKTARSTDATEMFMLQVFMLPMSDYDGIIPPRPLLRSIVS